MEAPSECKPSFTSVPSDHLDQQGSHDQQKLKNADDQPNSDSLRNIPHSAKLQKSAFLRPKLNRFRQFLQIYSRRDNSQRQATQMTPKDQTSPQKVGFSSVNITLNMNSIESLKKPSVSDHSQNAKPLLDFVSNYLARQKSAVGVPRAKKPSFFSVVGHKGLLPIHDLQRTRPNRVQTEQCRPNSDITKKHSSQRHEVQRSETQLESIKIMQKMADQTLVELVPFSGDLKNESQSVDLTKANFQSQETRDGSMSPKRRSNKDPLPVLLKPKPPSDIVPKAILFPDLILLTYRCCHVASERRTKQRFRFYVGPGNNCQLVVDTLKGRLQWEQTSEAEAADFVWTQKYYSPLTPRLPISSKRPAPNLSSFVSIHHASIQSSLMQRIFGPTDFSYVTNGSKQHNMYLRQKEKRQQLLQRVILDSSPNKLAQLLSQPQNLLKVTAPLVMHNHFKGAKCIGDKKELHKIVTLYSKFCKLTQNNITMLLTDQVPTTFYLENTNSLEFQAFAKKANRQSKTIWIVKPAQNSNRGQGIFLSNSLEEITSHLNRSQRSWIVQEYLTNPLLISRRKFDIRVYMLMVRVGGLTKSYWYQEGYLRTCSEQFDLNNLGDCFIHLTNDAVQKHHSKYGKNDKGNKISYAEFKKFLDPLNVAFESIEERMKAITAEVCRAACPFVDSRSLEAGFELFGLDFMVDADYKVWLIEVNTNPCLETPCPLLERLIPRLIQNTFRLSIDLLYRPIVQQKVNHTPAYLQNNGFSVIYDQITQENQQWEAYYTSKA